jgi:hypothetical protein
MHKNAALAPNGRTAMACRVVEAGLLAQRGVIANIGE